MKREIKFRFYRPSTNKMIYPTTGNFNDLIESEDWKVMQFTGLIDKQGKEIYEGDICKVIYYNHSTSNSELIQVVKYELGTFILEKQNTTSNLEDDRTKVPLYYCFAPNSIQVLGNVFENPQLLK